MHVHGHKLIVSICQSIDNCLLYTQLDHIQTLLQLFFQNVLKSNSNWSSILLLQILSLIYWLNIFKLIQILKYIHDSFYTDPFPQAA